MHQVQENERRKLMEAHGFPHEGKFTAKEVRKIADCFNTGNGFNIYEDCGDGVSLCAVKTIDCQSALRQGADAIEENAQLKARLEAVVKECEHFESMIARHGTLYKAEASNIYTAILRAARGEGGVE